MNAEGDKATYWQTMARYTGRSVRYLQIRAAVRATLVTVAVVLPFSLALPLK